MKTQISFRTVQVPHTVPFSLRSIFPSKVSIIETSHAKWDPLLFGTSRSFQVGMSRSFQVGPHVTIIMATIIITTMMTQVLRR